MVMLDAAPTTTVSVTRSIKAPVTQVYQAFTNSDVMQNWLCDEAHVRGAVAGHLLLIWNTNFRVYGSYTALEENQRVAFTWRGTDESQDSVVEVTLQEADGETMLTLSHTGFAEDADTSVYQKEWEKRLRHLGTMLETGADARIIERVIIGIIPGGFDANAAAKLGVPVTQGTRVIRVLDGLGAMQAGIQADDVVVAMKGVDVTPDMPMNRIVENNLPGDQVDVTFYRGNELHTVSLPLSGYPVPEMPASFAALADAYQTIYAELDNDIQALFDGVTEAQASQSPAPGEWSANQVLAHLILSERWVQHWIGGLMQGPEVVGFTGNTPARIAGIITTFTTNAALLAELRRAHAETLAVTRSVPDEYAPRKNYLWRTVFELQGFELHARQHMAQITEALTAARA
ncbi:MAG: SRPBCC domain-containing protein [Anaerolineae bacterium]|nr:SRPBCC domain-containing protein [Anaerolineae bacterium]